MKEYCKKNFSEMSAKLTAGCSEKSFFLPFMTVDTPAILTQNIDKSAFL
jgi:hypothetical protein